MRLIVTSKTDIAGTNIYHELAENFGFEKAGEFEGSPIYKYKDIWLISTKKNQTRANHLDRYFDAEYYVFASRHRSESGKKTLTCHVTGNLTSEAKVGGNPEELSYCNARAMKTALIELQNGKVESGIDYTVSMEATHHGPTELGKPVLFVEVGSTEKEWNDETAVRVVATAAFKAAASTAAASDTGDGDRNRDRDRDRNRDGDRDTAGGRCKNAVGIGGNHYAPIHTKVVLENDIAIGHIIPSYAIDEITEEVFARAFEKTDTRLGFLDWKGMKKEQRAKIKNLAKKLDIRLLRGKDIKGNIKRDSQGQRLMIDNTLFKEAEKTDRQKLSEFFINHGAVPVRDGNGRVTGTFISKTDIREELIKECIDIISGKVSRFDNSTLILKETRFDPKRAESLGIKPGPIFSKLSQGEVVEVDGKLIYPEMVMKNEEKILKIEDRITKNAMIKSLNRRDS